MNITLTQGGEKPMLTCFHVVRLLLRRKPLR